MNNLDKNELIKIIDETVKNLLEMKKKLGEGESVADYKNMPGIEGVFDGADMVASDGEKFPVPENYSAKSRIVFGDTLKLVDQDDKKVFKQVKKVKRITKSGIVTKKEGLWYVLTDSGAHRISNNAVEFNKLGINDQIDVILPFDNLTAPYAAFDKKINNTTLSTSQVTVQSRPAATREFVNDIQIKNDVSASGQVNSGQVKTKKKYDDRKRKSGKRLLSSKPDNQRPVNQKPINTKIKEKSEIPVNSSQQPVTKDKLDDDDLR